MKRSSGIFCPTENVLENIVAFNMFDIVIVRVVAVFPLSIGTRLNIVDAENILTAGERFVTETHEPIEPETGVTVKEM